MKRVLLIALLIAFTFGVKAQDNIFGKWKTIDDETGKAKSIVEIYEKDGKAYGKIVKLFRSPNEEQDPICDECEDDRKNKKIIGMEIIREMEKDGDEWEDGTILDPKSGKIYDCEIWRDGEELKVRGYIAFLYRTQTWLKAD
ncbi:DUF2147 domain-containing protein [Marivirga atlantica]|jgi:uncharacterized protein (DUF2147 family)|uniref:DUF2147 domain-containing protein n=1 Tax=Marivirga atlantica TaxID=1548457 RepID=A0A937AFC6_9BACT|nr:DUF2147 domain-containing protein [Marivirga atlantica]MBL0765464.1 DUF2147 domain-containing protein [Marivirga atlantica]